MSLFRRLIGRKRTPNYAEYAVKLYEGARFGSETRDTDVMRDFRDVFLSSEQGKRVFYTIMAQAGLYSPEMTPTDPNELNRAEGRRELAKHIMALTFGEARNPMEIETNDAQD